MLNQIAHPAPLLEHLVRRVLREREDVLGRVLFLLVQAAAFDADGVDEEGEQRERHPRLFFAVGRVFGMFGELGVRGGGAGGGAAAVEGVGLGRRGGRG